MGRNAEVHDGQDKLRQSNLLIKQEIHPGIDGTLQGPQCQICYEEIAVCSECVAMLHTLYATHIEHCLLSSLQFVSLLFGLVELLLMLLMYYH